MNNSLNYVALGDSLTVGSGAGLSRGFLKRYILLSERTLLKKVHLDVFAKNAMRSNELVSLIKRNPYVRRKIVNANIITITIGGMDLLDANRMIQKANNFLLFNNPIDQVSRNLKIILAEIQSLKAHAPSPYFIRIIGVYNPFPNLNYSDYWVNQFNYKVRSLCSSKLVNFVDIAPIFQDNPQLLSVDRLHPNRIGYHYMADAIAASGYYPFT